MIKAGEATDSTGLCVARQRSAGVLVRGARSKRSPLPLGTGYEWPHGSPAMAHVYRRVAPRSSRQRHGIVLRRRVAYQRCRSAALDRGGLLSHRKNSLRRQHRELKSAWGAYIDRESSRVWRRCFTLNIGWSGKNFSLVSEKKHASALDKPTRRSLTESRATGLSGWHAWVDPATLAGRVTLLAQPHPKGRRPGAPYVEPTT